MSTFGASASATSGLTGYDLEGERVGKVSKTEARYVSKSADQQCKTCTMFRAPRRCSYVFGKISPQGHCRFYLAMHKAHVTPKAAGMAIATSSGEVLFVKRSDSGDHAGEWSIPGGMIERDETPEQAAVREVWEEMGYRMPPGDRREIVTIDGDVPFSTFFQRIDGPFVPKLNKEHTEFRWAAPDGHPHPLHPGLKAALSVLISEVTQFTMKAANMENLAIFVPLSKVDVKQRLIYATAIDETPDRAKEIFDYASSKPHFAKWSADIAKASNGKSLGNVRSMHGKVAAGKLTDIGFDDKRMAIDVCVKVVDDGEWEKVEQGVYTGLSIGGRYEKRWKDGDYSRYTALPSEISLVDLPCVPSATFQMIKIDGAIEQRHFKEPPMVITNNMVIKRAEEMAKAAGDQRDWAAYLTDARKKIEGEMSARIAARNALTDGGRQAIEKKDNTDPPAGGERETPRSGKDFQQVWVSDRLPGQTFVKKDDMRQALVDLDAKEAAEKRAKGVLDLLNGKPVTKVWDSNAALPKTVQGLPDHAKTVFREAANKAIEGGANDESAMKIGWTAVKNGWKKVGGKWVRKTEGTEWLDKGLMKREYSSDQRKKYAKQGIAQPDGSFPIPDKEALGDAIHAYGRSGNKPATKRHIISRAKALGATSMLPEGWGGGKAKKLFEDVLGKLEEVDVEKAASLHMVANLCHLLGCVESVEEELEIEGPENPIGWGGILLNVDDDLQNRFGKMIVEFGDIVAEILDAVLAARTTEEAREAMERSAAIVDLVKYGDAVVVGQGLTKIGRRFSVETKAIIQSVMDAVTRLYETVVNPPKMKNKGQLAGGSVKDLGRVGGGGASTEEYDGDSTVTLDGVKPVGVDHPGSISTAGVGGSGPYGGEHGNSFKDMSADDLLKAATSGAARVAELEGQLAANTKAHDDMLTKIGELIEKKLGERDTKIDQLEKQLDRRLEPLAREVTVLRNQPMPLPWSSGVRVVDKVHDQQTNPNYLSKDDSDTKLRAAGMEAGMRRIMGPLTRRTEDSQGTP